MTTRALRESRYPERDRNDAGRAENAAPETASASRSHAGTPTRCPTASSPAPPSTVSATPLQRAVALFDEQRFFEAHEFLEYIWKSDEVPEADRDFWKGVTQIAVGCCHTQRGNAKGAVTLLERATRYMAPYPRVYHGIAADALAAGRCG